MSTSKAALVEAGPFRPHVATDSTLFRECCHRAGFAAEPVRSVLEGRSDRNIDIACVLRRTAEPSHFHSLLRLFVLGMLLDEPDARASLAPAKLEALIDAGLLERVPGGVRAVARLLPWRDFYLLSDFVPPEGEPLPADFVMSGTSASSLSLTRLTLRRPVRSALDIGTGAGIHALLAAAHADRVVATDTNRRALNFAWMNARLNGIENISFVEGSFFEPINGKFDLIVSNPPFIISPQSRLMFQNPGLGGDGVSELFIREAPRYLNEGGCAVSLVSWYYAEPDAWAERPSGWAQGSGCDFWLMRVAADDPIDYATNALRQTESIRSPHYAEQLDQWLNYYQELGITHLALGAVILRKRTAAKHWVHCEQLSGVAAAGDASDQIERVFAAEDFLSSAPGDEPLLNARLLLHPDHVLEQKLAAGDDGWSSRSLTLVAARGIDYRAAIDVRVLGFLSACNGVRTLRELIAEVAEEGGVDFATAATGGLALARRLLRYGFLVVK